MGLALVSSCVKWGCWASPAVMGGDAQGREGEGASCVPHLLRAQSGFTWVLLVSSAMWGLSTPLCPHPGGIASVFGKGTELWAVASARAAAHPSRSPSPAPPALRPSCLSPASAALTAALSVPTPPWPGAGRGHREGGVPTAGAGRQMAGAPSQGSWRLSFDGSLRRHHTALLCIRVVPWGAGA